MQSGQQSAQLTLDPANGPALVLTVLAQGPTPTPTPEPDTEGPVIASFRCTLDRIDSQITVFADVNDPSGVREVNFVTPDRPFPMELKTGDEFSGSWAGSYTMDPLPPTFSVIARDVSGNGTETQTWSIGSCG